MGDGLCRRSSALHDVNPRRKVFKVKVREKASEYVGGFRVRLVLSRMFTAAGEREGGGVDAMLRRQSEKKCKHS